MNFLVVDVETDGLAWQTNRLHGVAVAWGKEAHECEYYLAGSIPQNVLAALSSADVPKVGHNFRFDLKFLHMGGVLVGGEFHDTRLIAHLLDENSPTGLKELVPRYLGAGRLADKSAMDAACGRAGVRNIAELCALDLDGNEKFPPGSFTEIIAQYAKEDATNTFDLFNRLCDLLGQDADLVRYYQEEAQPFERVLLDMELQGIAVDESVLDKYGAELRTEQARLEHEMSRLLATQINNVEERLYAKAVEKRKSPKGKEKVQRRSAAYSTVLLYSSTSHIGELIYRELGADVRRTAKGGYSTDEATLADIAKSAAPPLSDFLSLFAQWRGVQKNLSTYVDGLKEAVVGNRIHASYGQYTTTGRTHSSEPNMQNLPRGSVVKRAFVPAPGNCFVYFDYSQIELRIAAHLSGDPTMIENFRLGMDAHKVTAAKIFGVCETDEQRQVGKTCNFLLIYDGSPGRLWEELGGRFTKDECKEFKRAYFEGYPGYKAWLEDTLDEVQRNGQLVSPTGRTRRVPDIEYGTYLKWQREGDGWRCTFSGPGRLMESLRAYQGEYLSEYEVGQRASRRYSHAKKQAYNFPVQHLGATIMKRALMSLRAKGYTIVTSVHDSAVIELPIERLGEVPAIQQLVETAVVLSVPLKADFKLLCSLDEKDLLNKDSLRSLDEKDLLSSLGVP